MSVSLLVVRSSIYILVSKSCKSCFIGGQFSVPLWNFAGREHRCNLLFSDRLAMSMLRSNAQISVSAHRCAGAVYEALSVSCGLWSWNSMYNDVCNCDT